MADAAPAHIYITPHCTEPDLAMPFIGAIAPATPPLAISWRRASHDGHDAHAVAVMVRFPFGMGKSVIRAPAVCTVARRRLLASHKDLRGVRNRLATTRFDIVKLLIIPFGTRFHYYHASSTYQKETACDY